MAKFTLYVVAMERLAVIPMLKFSLDCLRVYSIVHHIDIIAAPSELIKTSNIRERILLVFYIDQWIQHHIRQQPQLFLKASHQQK